jgi:hypothetical protein
VPGSLSIPLQAQSATRAGMANEDKRVLPFIVHLEMKSMHEFRIAPHSPSKDCRSATDWISDS